MLCCKKGRGGKGRCCRSIGLRGWSFGERRGMDGGGLLVGVVWGAIIGMVKERTCRVKLACSSFESRRYVELT